MLPMSMVPPFDAYPVEPSFAAIDCEGIRELADQNVELMSENMKLRAKIDSLSARDATSEAGWRKGNDCTTGETIIASDTVNTPRSRVSQSSHRSKTGMLKSKAGGDDMSRTWSTVSTMATSRVPSERSDDTEVETWTCKAHWEAEARKIRGLRSGLLVPP